MSAEPKPPVKGELHDVIYVVGKSIDEHADHEDRNNMWSHKEAWNKCAKYVRDDIVAEKDRTIASLTGRVFFAEQALKSSIVIPADDFGRICEALAQSISFVEEAEEQKMVEVLCTIKKWLKRWNEALALARKYGSAE